MTRPTTICPHCRSQVDAARPCNVWLEQRCADPECEFCMKRPERPQEGV